MNNQAITDKYYKEVVKDLNEVILHDRDLWYSYIINLPIHLQVVYTIITFHQQVYNGGFHQYFFNAYGQFAYLTLDNLKLIKAFQASAILEEALSKVNIEQYDEADFREKIFNRKIDRIVNFDNDLGDILNDLDNKYYSLEENLEQLLVDFTESC